MTARNLVMAAAGYGASTGGPGVVAITGSTTSTWNPASAPLSLATAGTYYLTPSTNIVVNSKMWGAAGGSCQDVDGNRGGAGGFSSGTITLLAGQTYTVIVGGGGAGGNINAGGGGGGFSGIFETTTVSQATAWLMAGGGGGGIGDNGTGYPGGAAGGGTFGQNGLGWRTSTTESGGQGGTQFAGGAASSGTGVPVAGSALQGGTSGSRNVAGGTPGGGGAGSNGYGYDGGGGGGGYYGGGPGASGNPSGKSFGGGGSGFVNQGKVVNGTTITGARVTPANSADADRGTAGQPVQNGNGNPGKVVLTYVSAQGTTDTQFNNVSLLLHGDGTNGAQNNTFLDSSTNAIAMTSNTNPGQGTFSPYGSTWSNYFDGSSFLTVPDSEAFNFAAGDFTIEAWIYPTAYGTSYNGSIYGLIVGQWYVSTGWAFQIGIAESTKSFFLNVNGSALVSTGNNTISLNQWQHVAAVRSGNTFTLYINGVSQGTTTNSLTITNSSSQLYIARNEDAGGVWSFVGNISNLRIVKGVAVYTSAFTPPTSQLTVINGTSILTCHTNRFVDSSSNNFTVTRNGTVLVTKESPFKPLTSYDPSVFGGSVYVNGSGSNVLTTSSNTNLAVGTNPYTIEGWFYFTGSSVGTLDNFFGCQRTSFSSGRLIFYYSSGSLQLTPTGGSGATTGSITLVPGQWYHIAGTRDASNNQRLFVNGTLLATTTNTTNYGEDGFGINGYSSMTGYVSDARLIVGTALYTASFTPPTSPLTAVTNTKILLKFTNAGIIDSAAENTFQTIGNAQISTSVKKYGTGSIAFDGSGDWIKSPVSTIFGFGTGDFTIECWVNTTVGNTVVFDNRTVNGPGVFYISSSGAISYYDPSYPNRSGTSNCANGQWNHLAWCRASGTFRMFVNGVREFSASIPSDFGSLRPGWVGADFNSGAAFNGYIDDLRITKGVARYTANFTPPTAAFPDQ